MADLLPTALSGLALLVAVAKPLGAFLARLVDGIRSAPAPEAAGRESRSAIVPRALTHEEKVEILWDERDARASALDAAATVAAEKATVKALRRLVTQAAGDATPKPKKESADGEHSPTDPDPRP